MKKIMLPYTEEAILSVQSGDDVLLSGTLYVGRDQVHKRLYEAIEMALIFLFRLQEMVFTIWDQALPLKALQSERRDLRQVPGWIHSLLFLYVQVFVS